MTRAERNVNLAAVIIPFLGLLAAAILAWNNGWLHSRDLVIFGVMYVFSAFGVTVGFHRMLTHRAFETYKPLRNLLAVMGSLSVQGPVLDWVADHRKHHAFTDEEGDPHSPHAGHGAGFGGMVRGLWHAHVGWLWETNGQAQKRRYCPDLLEEPGLRWIHAHFLHLTALTLAVPFAAGWVWSGSLLGGLEALLWGGLVRIFLMHHATWSVNSVCHFFGSRRFDTGDFSTNVFWLSLPTLGESWHHNHHAFPRSARHGLRWYELDPSGWLIQLFAKAGLAWDVVLIDREKQKTKLAKPGGAGRPEAAGVRA